MSEEERGKTLGREPEREGKDAIEEFRSGSPGAVVHGFVWLIALLIGLIFERRGYVCAG